MLLPFRYHAFDTSVPPFYPSQAKKNYSDSVFRPWKNGSTVTRFDATPAYLRDPKVPERMASFCSFDKPPRFLVLLCNPTNRVWSAFAMDRTRHLKKERASSKIEASNHTLLAAEFDTCMRAEVPAISQCLEEFGYERCGELLYGGSKPSSVPSEARPLVQDAIGHLYPCSGQLYSSLYSEQLGHWTKFFPRESFLVLHQDQWKVDPWGAVLAVAVHFGLPQPTHRPPTLAPGYMANVGVYHAASKPSYSTLKLLRDFFRSRSEWRDWISKEPFPAGGGERSEGQRGDTVTDDPCCEGL